MDESTLKRCLEEVMSSRHDSNCYPSDHRDFVALLIRRDARRQRRWDRIREQVGGWAVICLLSGTAALAWAGLQALLKKAGIK